MKYEIKLAAWLALLLAAAMASASCGGDGTTGNAGGSSQTSSSSGQGGQGGTTSTTSAGGGGTGGSGMGGMGPTDKGAQSTDFVNGGTVAKSQSYKMVLTVGQSTQNQTRTKSQSYSMQGGLIGATGSLK